MGVCGSRCSAVHSNNRIRLNYSQSQLSQQGSDEVCTLVSADTLSYTLENLNPESNYSIRISAINAFGEGPSLEANFTTGII